MDRHSVHTDYLTGVFNPEVFKRKLNLAQEKLKDVEFDAFAVRGNSGTLFGGALADRMNKGLILVRKEDDRSHSTYRVEGLQSGQKYIFLDDLVFQGKTRDAVIEAIERDRYFRHYQMIGTLLYRDMWWDATPMGKGPKLPSSEPPNPDWGMLPIQTPQQYVGLGWMEEYYRNMVKDAPLMSPPAPVFSVQQDPGKAEVKIPYLWTPGGNWQDGPMYGTVAGASAEVPVPPVVLEKKISLDLETNQG